VQAHGDVLIDGNENLKIAFETELREPTPGRFAPALAALF
jgi:hypothetical protein